MPIMGLLLGFLDLAEAEENGVEYEGDPAILDRIRAEPAGQFPSIADRANTKPDIAAAAQAARSAD